MTRIMYDSTNPAEIPANAVLVASYVDGFGGYDAAVARFGANKVVSISVANHDADVADVESGAMSPGDLPEWLQRQYARGLQRPVVYCSLSVWPSVKAAVGTRSVSYWIADWKGAPFSIAGADAVQYANGPKYDTSLVLDTFPIHPVPPPPKPVPLKQTGTVHSVTTGGNAAVYSVDGGQTWTYHKPAGF
jgi:hypothetical protein